MRLFFSLPHRYAALKYMAGLAARVHLRNLCRLLLSSQIACEVVEMNPDEFAHAAHDLSNVLQVLTYRSAQLLNSLDAWDPIRVAVQEIEAEISRAVPLMRQLVQAAEVNPVQRNLPSWSLETQFKSKD